MATILVGCRRQLDVQITDAWSRPSTGVAGATGGGRAAVYMVIRNDGDQSVRAAAVNTESADVAEFHESITVDNIARMRPLESGFAVPPGREVTLAPGGIHVMLIGVRGQLSEGDRFTISIRFESPIASTVVAVPVTVQSR